MKQGQERSIRVKQMIARLRGTRLYHYPANAHDELARDEKKLANKGVVGLPPALEPATTPEEDNSPSSSPPSSPPPYVPQMSRLSCAKIETAAQHVDPSRCS